MQAVKAALGTELFLGRCGENMATCVVFDVSDWEKTYGEGTVQLIHQRNGDKNPYPCVIEQNGSSVVWNITSSDVAVAGRGRVELQYFVGETLVKSETFATVTERALGRASETPPAPYEGWMENMLGMASETGENAAAAAQSASESAKSAAAAKASEQNASSVERIADSHKQDAANAAARSEAAAAGASAASTAAQASAAAAAASEVNAASSANTASTSADRAEAARDSIVLDEQKMEQAVANAEASATAAEASKTAAAASAESVGNAAETASAAAKTATSEADRAKAEADRAASAAGGDFVVRTGDTMTGDLEISKGIPMLRFTVPGGESYAEIKKNAGADVDMGININDFASEGNYTQLNLCHKDKALRLRVTENGVATGAYDIYHEGNKPVAADVGAVNKTGDTMTGVLQMQPDGSAGYGKLYKNASADGDYGLQLQDVDPDGNFMGLTLSGKLQKLEFKKKRADEDEYRYTKLYDTENPPSAEEVGALSEDGGEVYGNVKVKTEYGKVIVESAEGHTTELVKNGGADEDYGTILRDTNGDKVAELKLSAANSNVKLAVGGKEYAMFHEGRCPTAAQVGAASASKFYDGYLTIHVAKTGSDTTGNGSEANPYLTIQKAVNSIPKVVTGPADINVHSGAYDEHITFSSFTSGSSIRLVGVAGESVQVKSINLWNNNVYFTVENIEVTGTMEDNYNASIMINNCRTVELRYVTCVQPVASAIYGAIHCSSNPVVRLFNCTISNKPTAVEVVASTVFMNNGTTGTGNTVAIRCGSGYGQAGGFVQKGGATIEGTETTAYGGQIF